MGNKNDRSGGGDDIKAPDRPLFQFRLLMDCLFADLVAVTCRPLNRNLTKLSQGGAGARVSHTHRSLRVHITSRPNKSRTSSRASARLPEKLTVTLSALYTFWTRSFRMCSADLSLAYLGAKKTSFSPKHLYLYNTLFICKLYSLENKEVIVLTQIEKEEGGRDDEEDGSRSYRRMCAGPH